MMSGNQTAPASPPVAPGRTTETAFEEMKRYVRFTDDDARSLADFGTVARPHFERIAAEFYDRTREHEDAHRVFTGEAQIDRLRVSLVRWMERLCFGPHDESYFAERSKIGRVHVRIGLPQRFMFTGMATIRTAFEGLTNDLARDRADAIRGALARILDLELAIMLETYRDDLFARLQRVERAETEQILRRLAVNEHRYVNAVELARVVVIGMDAHGRIGLFNREAERLTGWARDEAVGADFVERFVPEDRRQRDGDRVRAAGRGDPNALGAWEGSILARHGGERSVRWQFSYVPDAKDDDVVIFAMGVDVTDANALHERTIRSERLAAVGTLAAGLAHEIRNPLNGALLHVTFLERALGKMSGVDDALKAAGIVGEEIRRLSALVRDFLVFARPGPAAMKPTSLYAVCKRAAEITAPDAATAHAKLELQLGTSDVEMLADGEKIEQLLINLIRNAVEAVGSIGGGTVILRARRKPRRVLLDVEDDGPGLPNADAPIFDAFYSTKPAGTGLGLAIVQRIASDHGGTVNVDSKPGRTVFRVELPISQGIAGDAA